MTSLRRRAKDVGRGLRRLAHGGREPVRIPRNVDEGFAELCRRCGPHSMVSPPRMHSLYQAVRHVVANDVPGAVVECGVWRGGCMMLAALALGRLGDTSRSLYLYDTFRGMPPPDAADGPVARERWSLNQKRGGWCASSLDEVQRNMARTGYPAERIRYVEGKVEETIPGVAPDEIAILRLDTDWHGSTLHELEHLYPRLARGGVLLVDDYGHWPGVRTAVDEYIERERIDILLHRVDSSGRTGVKT
ncbi:MAG: TylF/MycF/NovP-related O-methyltransferase [Planctomycetota bacterium]